MMKTKTTLVAVVATLATALSAPAFAQKTTGDMVDDGTIAASIKAGLLDNKATSSMQINVESYKGTVQLSGFVESQAEKDAAGKLATDVDGVKKVINSIAIAPKTSMGTKLDDSLVTGKVKAALMDAKDVKSMQINVETKNGVTQLAGFVTSQGMKERAGKVAADVSGVKQVDNVLVVKPKE
ncbi:MAG TPA: BON domain-containing protein [Steroidobacteraceae bacterium]